MFVYLSLKVENNAKIPEANESFNIYSYLQEI